MNHRVAALVARLKALNAQRAAVALELAEALGSDPGASLMNHAGVPDLGDPDPVDDVEPPAKRAPGRPLSERTRAILRFIKMRKKATPADFAFLGLSRTLASTALDNMTRRGFLVRVARGTYAIPDASESFAATLKKAAKATATRGPGRRKGQLFGPQSAATKAIIALKGDITVERVMKLLNISEKQARDKLVGLCNKRKALVRVGPATYRAGTWGGGDTTAPSE